MQISLLPGLAGLVPHYEVFVIDLWGVVHNGFQPYPGVIDCLQRLKKHNKTIIFLSNAPRRIDASKALLMERGIVADLYDDLYTSGEECHCFLRDRTDAWYQALGSHLFHIGPERDRNIFSDLPFTQVAALDQADFILNTGTYHWESSLSDYDSLLEHAYKRNLPMICANPDQMVMHGQTLTLCAGAIAKRYQELGGKVRYHGKPHGEIYTSVIKLAASPLQKILVIGDSLATDITGARNAGMDSVFIMGGIHAPHLFKKTRSVGKERLHRLIRSYNTRPNYALKELMW